MYPSRRHVASVERRHECICEEHKENLPDDGLFRDISPEWDKWGLVQFKVSLMTASGERGCEQVKGLSNDNKWRKQSSLI